MNFFVFTSRGQTMPIASFLVAHSHGRNFFADLAAASESLVMHSSTEAFYLCKAKTVHLKNFAQFCQTR